MIDKFFEKVSGSKPDECWEWTAYKDKQGYGHFNFQGTTKQAHRVSWFIEYEEWPEGELHHICENPSCVNPAHLETKEHWEHTREHGTSPVAINASKTHCIHGHEFTPENTATPPSGGRKCKTCQRIRQEKYKEAKAAVAYRGKPSATQLYMELKLGGSARAVSIIYGVSDTTIRNWVKRYKKEGIWPES